MRALVVNSLDSDISRWRATCQLLYTKLRQRGYHAEFLIIELAKISRGGRSRAIAPKSNNSIRQTLCLVARKCWRPAGVLFCCIEMGFKRNGRQFVSGSNRRCNQGSETSIDVSAVDVSAVRSKGRKEWGLQQEGGVRADEP